MYAVVCNDDTSTLYCGPNKEKDFYCTNPHDKWLHAKCKKHGGFKKIDESASGCYPTNPSFWEDVIGLSNGEEFCGAKLPSGVIKASLEAHVADTMISDVNLGFEKGDFTGWTTSSGSDGSTAVVYNPSFAKEGVHYAELSGTQSITRNFDLQDADPKPSTCGDLGLTVCISFWYRFQNSENFCAYYNDWMTVSFSQYPAGPLLFADLKDTCDGSTGWLQAQIEIDDIPAGFNMFGTINNSRDTLVDSFAYFDGFEVTGGACY